MRGREVKDETWVPNPTPKDGGATYQGRQEVQSEDKHHL